jgi:hypothetical protein
MRILGLSLFLALSLASTVASAQSDISVSKKYQKCLRAHSKDQIDTTKVRYNDDLFKSALEKCSSKLIALHSEETRVDKMHRLTQIYITTLRVLNSFPRREEDSYDPSSSISAPQSPQQEPLKQASVLDGFMQRDFIILYTPWLSCLASEMNDRGTAKPEEYIYNAQKQCEKICLLADSEALTLLDDAGGYGSKENQQKIISNSQATLQQMLVISALRADGERLGTALKRSEQVVK